MQSLKHAYLDTFAILSLKLYHRHMCTHKLALSLPFLIKMNSSDIRRLCKNEVSAIKYQCGNLVSSLIHTTLLFNRSRDVQKLDLWLGCLISQLSGYLCLNKSAPPISRTISFLAVYNQLIKPREKYTNLTGP